MQQSFAYSFSKTGNTKTGKIPTTKTTSNSCPSNCPLKSNGCYAENHWQGIQWRKLDNGQGSITIDQLADKIKALPDGQLWRHNIAGDLAHNNEQIRGDMLLTLIDANKGKRGFTYTHHRLTGEDVIASNNRYLVTLANAQGFTVNLSANNPMEADTLAKLGIGPVVTLLPEDYGQKNLQTPYGRSIVVCPAVTTEGVTCASCGLCAKVDRKSIVGFPVHGTGKNKARTIMLRKG